MANIRVDFSKTTAKIKPLHGVGQPPLSGTNYDMFKYLRDAGVPFSRLHDVAGWFGGNMYVDIPNLFRDFDADPYDPANYDFTFTDMLLKALVENGVEPYFRLGVTIENFAEIKYYRIAPPKDFKKWAIICEHVIKHYNYGWADGFEMGIRYWEIWNEPDNYETFEKNHMWKGTKEQYYELYEVASKHLKSCFPEIKIGGYGSSGFYRLAGSRSLNTGSLARYDYLVEFFVEFVKYIKEHDCPLDFFSWHNYDYIEPLRVFADYVRKSLDDAGYTHAESSCNEWAAETQYIGTARHAAFICGTILAMQNMPIDNAMLYDGRCGMGPYSPLFSPLDRSPRPAYYGLVAFNELYKRGNQVELECDTDGIYAVAARDDNGDGYLVIANTVQQDFVISYDLGRKIKECFLIDDNHSMTKIPVPAIIKANDILCIRV